MITVLLIFPLKTLGSPSLSVATCSSKLLFNIPDHCWGLGWSAICLKIGIYSTFVCCTISMYPSSVGFAKDCLILEILLNSFLWNCRILQLPPPEVMLPWDMLSDFPSFLLLTHTVLICIFQDRSLAPVSLGYAALPWQGLICPRILLESLLLWTSSLIYVLSISENFTVVDEQETRKTAQITRQP